MSELVSGMIALGIMLVLPLACVIKLDLNFKGYIVLTLPLCALCVFAELLDLWVLILDLIIVVTIVVLDYVKSNRSGVIE